jgi:two-component system response regulator HydG
MDSNTERVVRVLVVDDEPVLLKALETLLAKKGHHVTALDSPIAATQRLAQEDFDVALLDVKMPDLSGLELLTAVKHRRPEVEVIMMTGHATVETALSAVKAGAYDYLTKPFEDVELVARVVAKAAERKRLFDRNRELETALREKEGGVQGDGLVGNSGPMRDVTRMIDAVAYSAATVLVQGESGTGKELVARALHVKSPRRGEPFVALNCGALTETLLESELFGHVKGAFTGAQRDQKGLFDAADGGTIFLDEIGDIPPATQVRLLRVLQEGEVKRVGSAESIKVDVRVIAATHRDLPKLVKSGRFREDLFYRLNVIAIPLPPLRDRIEDVPLLAHHFLRRYTSRLAALRLRPHRPAHPRGARLRRRRDVGLHELRGGQGAGAATLREGLRRGAHARLRQQHLGRGAQGRHGPVELQARAAQVPDRRRQRSGGRGAGAGQGERLLV